MPDLNGKVPDLGVKVPDPKLEVPDLKSGGIRLNLTPGLSYVNSGGTLSGSIRKSLTKKSRHKKIEIIYVGLYILATTEFRKQLDNKRRRPSVNVDAFAILAACCDLDL